MFLGSLAVRSGRISHPPTPRRRPESEQLSQLFEPRARTLLGVCFCGRQHDFIADVRCSFCNFVIFPTFQIFSAGAELTLAIPSDAGMELTLG
jgi:hypothetical protein